MINYLIAICALLQNQNLQPEQVKFETELSSGTAIFSFRFNALDSLNEEFFVTDPKTQRPIECKKRNTAINRNSSITGAALIEIIERT